MIANRVKQYSNPLAYTLLAVDSVPLVGNPITFPSIMQLDTSHFVVAYGITAGSGRIMAISCDLTYGDLAVTDWIEHDLGGAQYNSLIKIDDTHIMLAYQSLPSFDGFLKVFTIDGSYEITETSSYEFETTLGEDMSLVQIDLTHYILACGGTDSDGFIKTFSIDGAYAFTELHSLEHDTAKGGDNSLLKLDATHYILAYSGNGSDGFIKVFTIDGSYDITETSVLEHDTDGGVRNTLIQLDASHFALAYSATTSYLGTLKTFSMDGAYAVTEIDAEIFRNDSCLYISACKVDSSHVIITYQGVDSDGFMEVWGVDGAYALSQTSSWEFSTVDTGYFNAVQISLNYYIMAWNFEPVGNGNAGTFILS